MIRYGTYSIEEVLSRVTTQSDPQDKARATFNGESVRMTSHRYKLFLEKGLSCVRCGITGSFFALEKGTEQERSCHFNLYALDENGDEVLMTKDHIVPKCMGGLNVASNYQVLCTNCNHIKGKVEGSISFILKALREHVPVWERDYNDQSEEWKTSRKEALLKQALNLMHNMEEALITKPEDNYET